MKEYKKILIQGAVICLFVPVIAFFLSSFFVTEMNIVDFVKHLISERNFNDYLSLMILFNALLFFLFIKRKEYVSRGILMSTFLYALFILIVNLSV